MIVATRRLVILGLLCWLGTGVAVLCLTGASMELSEALAHCSCRADATRPEFGCSEVSSAALWVREACSVTPMEVSR